MPCQFNDVLEALSLGAVSVTTSRYDTIAFPAQSYKEGMANLSTREPHNSLRTNLRAALVCTCIKEGGI